jgi:hypothetical protein
MDITYRIQFQDGLDSQYHNITDVLDRNPNNIFGEPRGRVRHIPEREPQRSVETTNQHRTAQRTSQAQPRRQIAFQNIMPNFDPLRNYLYISPFNGSVNRHPFNFIYGDVFSSFFMTPTEDVFMDNFASNFTSNFANPMTRIIFIQTNMNEGQQRPAASREAVKQLKRFKMNEEYCKKKDEKLEYPTCSVCLVEINKEEDTVLIPCGHLFHEGCITKWLDMNNTCPVCRYELPTDDSNRRNNTARGNMNFSNVRSS